VVLEQGADDQVPEIDNLELADDRTYGETRILIFVDTVGSPLGGAETAQ